MVTPHSWLNRLRMVPLSADAVITTAINSDWIGLKEYRGVIITVVTAAGRSTTQDDQTLTLRQATTNAGATAKALVPRRAYRRQGSDLAAAAAATPTVLETPSTGVHLDGDMVNIVDIELDASELDVNTADVNGNHFAYVQARLPAVSGGTARAHITALAVAPRQVLAPEQLANPLA